MMLRFLIRNRFTSTWNSTPVRYYSIFDRLKANKVTIASKETLIDQVSPRDSESIAKFQAFLRAPIVKIDTKLFAGTKKTILQYCKSNPKEFNSEASNLIAENINKLRLSYNCLQHDAKNRQSVSNGTVPLITLFSNTEDLLLLFQWFVNNSEPKFKLSRMFISEAFMVLKNSNLNVQQQIDAHLYFNKFLNNSKVYKEALDLVDAMLSLKGIDSDYLKRNLLKNLKDTHIDNPILIFEYLKKFNKSEADWDWVLYFIGSYKEKVSKNTDDIFIAELAKQDLIVKVVERLGGTDISRYCDLLNLLKDLPEERLILQKLSEQKNELINLSNKQFCLILQTSIKFKDCFSLNETLIKHVSEKTGGKLSRQSLNLILADKVMRSNTDDFNDEHELKAEIETLIHKDARDFVEPEPIDDSELVIDVLRDERFVNTQTLNVILSANLLKSVSYIDCLTEYFETLDIELNEETFSLLIKHAIINDLGHEASKKLFQKSLNYGVLWDNNETNLVLNDLVQYIFGQCKQYAEVEDCFKTFQTIKSFIDIDVTSINCMLKVLLDFDYIGDALELLNQEFVSSMDTETSTYFGKMNEEDLFNLENDTLNKRKIDLNNGYTHKIFNTLYEFLMTKCNEFEVAWSIYTTIHRCFHNVPFETYLPIMHKFIDDYKRPDGALIIFAQMKKLNRLFGLPQPNESHYTYLLTKFGEMCYEDGLIELHTLMKMDLQINANIDMMNALLQAYTSVQNVLKTRDLFEQMLAVPKDNKNAINSKTINIMLESYTYGSLNYVKDFWNNLSKLDYIPDENNYKQFIKSCCYYEEYEEAFGLLEEMRFNELEISKDLISEILTKAKENGKEEMCEKWLVSNGFKELIE